LTGISNEKKSSKIGQCGARPKGGREGRTESRKKAQRRRWVACLVSRSEKKHRKKINQYRKTAIPGKCNVKGRCGVGLVSLEPAMRKKNITNETKTQRLCHEKTKGSRPEKKNRPEVDDKKQRLTRRHGEEVLKLGGGEILDR